MPIENLMERARAMAKLYWASAGEHDDKIKVVAKSFKCRVDTAEKYLNLLLLAKDIQRAVELRALGLEEAQGYAALSHDEQRQRFIAKMLDGLENGSPKEGTR